MSPLKQVFFISGLGANERAFSFLDLSFCQPCYLHWIPPLGKETLEVYAGRMARLIPEESSIIVGLSLGGMLGMEIAKLRPSCRVILISSAKTRFEVPWYYRIWRFAPLYRLGIRKTKRWFSPIITWLNGPKGAPQKEVFESMLLQSSPAFTKWAIDAILSWQNTVVPKNVIHLHGTSDKILPFRFVMADYAIANGEHVMLMNQPKEISTLLRQLILE